MPFLNQSGPVCNGAKSWIQIEGENAIWLNKNDSNWVVGLNSNLGTSKYLIAGPKENLTLPHEIKDCWKYKDSWWKWKIASMNDISFKDGNY